MITKEDVASAIRGLSPAVLADANATAEALMPLLTKVREETIEECARAAEAQDRTGREWVKDSLWANIISRVPRAIRALKAPVAA